jgi:hypothetical protein
LANGYDVVLNVLRFKVIVKVILDILIPTKKTSMPLLLILMVLFDEGGHCHFNSSLEERLSQLKVLGDIINVVVV